jgi:hypothetical protein
MGFAPIIISCRSLSISTLIPDLAALCPLWRQGELRSVGWTDPRNNFAGGEDTKLTCTIIWI